MVYYNIGDVLLSPKDGFQILYCITPVIHLSDGQTLKSLTLPTVIESIGNWNSHALLVGMSSCPTLSESSLVVFSKIKKAYTLQSSNSISGYIL